MINLQTCVEMGTGEFCWLFGSDDALLPGALKTVVDTIGRHPEISAMTCMWRTYTADMRAEIGSYFETMVPDRPHEHIYTNFEETIGDLGMWMTFYSAQIFRKSAWTDFVRATDRDLIFSFRNYTIIFIIGKIIEANLKWMWLGVPLVKYRSFNMEVLRAEGR
jgi:hypothetical protein